MTTTSDDRLRTCAGPECDNPLPEGARRNRRYCDDVRCKAKRQYAAIKADPDRYEAFKAKSKITMRDRFANMTPPERAAWSLRRREQNGAARARRMGAPVEDIDVLRDIILVRGIRCYICGGRTELALGVRGKPGPLVISIDHVVPFENGGGHTVENCRTAHHGCNALKQDRPPEWAREHSERRDAPAPTVAQLHALLGALALTSDDDGVLLDETEAR